MNMVCDHPGHLLGGFGDDIYCIHCRKLAAAACYDEGNMAEIARDADIAYALNQSDEQK